MRSRSILTFLCLIALWSIPTSLWAQRETFTNPILGGDYPDPTIMRDGEDYYMTHSAFDYVPGLVVFHSRDLVHWEPISSALNTFLGSVWAPDICKYKDKYYIYFTVAYPSDAVRAKAGRNLRPSSRMNFVVTADSPYGPWSEPVDLGVANIDPCHVVGEDGQRWLFLSGGKRAKLTPDGLHVVPGTEEVVYPGWMYPAEWLTEGLCLEGPKLRKIGDYYYYLNAEGGTAGPPTSHMVVVARSKSINGPWEDSPYNPLIHTYANSNRWWSRGHGSLIDTPDGRWYCVYHAYENGFTDIGRQTLLEPVEFTADGWFRPVIKDREGLSADPVGPIAAPIANETTNYENPKAALGKFRVGLEWKSYRANEPERIEHVANGIRLKGKGQFPGNSSPLMFVAGDHRYEIEAEIELSDVDTRAGLVLYYDSVFHMGTGFDTNRRYRYRKGGQSGGGMHPNGDTRHLWLRLRNDNHVVTGSYSYDGVNWNRETWGMDCSGYNHNTLYQFQSVLPGIFCAGKGSATFTNFKYRNLDIEDAKAAMRRAATFMMDSISYKGAFVWSYLPDRSRQWGELEAPYRSLVWIQEPSTPSVGHLMLDAYHATGDEYYYDQALRIAKVLISVQHPEGGWNYVEDLNGEEELKEFYRTIGRQAWRLEEFQHYYGNCTFDDEATSICATLMLRVYLEKKDPAVHKALDKVISFMIRSQYSNGGWPQRYPLMYDHPFRGKEDYSSFITLNDDVMPANIEFLIQCYQELGRKDLLKPIRKALDLSLKLQQPAPFAGWGDQYFVKTLKPAHARSYEPRAINTSTTVRMVNAMMDYYRLTGESKFLKGIPAAIEFLRSQKLPAEEASRYTYYRPVTEGFQAPRFLVPEDGTPMYVHRRGSNVGNGEYYTDQEISGTIAHYGSCAFINPDALQRSYQALKQADVKEVTASSPLLYPKKNIAVPVYYYKPSPMGGGRTGRGGFSIQDILKSQQPGGGWLTPLGQISNVYKPMPENQTPSTTTKYATTFVGDEYDTSPYSPEKPVLGYSTRSFIQYMTQLIHFVKP